MRLRDWILVGLAGGLIWFFQPSERKEPVVNRPRANVVAMKTEPYLPVPRQTEPRRTQPWNVREIQFQSLAHYEITARVVSKHDYRDAGLTELAPFDLGLVWGQVSDPYVYPEFQFSQEGRFLRWRWSSNMSFSADDARQCISNVHMIPADDRTRALLTAVQVGEVLTAKGELVFVVDPYAGTTWKSSLVRTDTGDGACEIMWVEHVELK